MRTKYFKPYTPKGDCTLKPSQGARPGVYIVRKGDQVVYVGHSASNLYKTMYRHFQSWNDPAQRRVTYVQLKDISIRVIFCSASKAPVLEEALIIKYKPRDNYQKLELYTSKQRAAIIADADKGDFIPISEVPF